MSVDFTAFDAQVTGTDGAAGSAGGTIDGGDGGNAIDSLPPYSNTDFSLEPSLNRVFPTTIGGNGGNGAGGANATATTPALQGGLGGKGGAAFITMANDMFGSASTHYAGFVTITATANGLPGGLARRRWRRWRQRRARYHRDHRRERLDRIALGPTARAAEREALARSRTPI